MTEVRHDNPQDPDITPKIQHSGDLGLEQPFLDENGEPAFGTKPINEDHLGDPAGIFARLSPEQQQEALRTAGIVFGDKTQEADHDTPTPPDIDHPEDTDNKEVFWTRRKKVMTAVGAGVAVLISGAFGIARVFGNNSSVTAPQTTPSAAAPTNPGATPNSTPSTAETTPDIKMPFDPKQVAIMRKASVEEFYEDYGQALRIQYGLSDQYDQTENGADYEVKLQQKLPDNMVLSDYNSFKTPLSADADPQDVMRYYEYGQFGAIAHTDVDEGIKALGAVVADPQSEAFKELRAQVEKNTGKRAADSIINSKDYEVLRAKRTHENGKTKLTIITNGGFQYVFVFVSVKNLSEAAQTTEDAGVWLIESNQLGKVTINF